MCVWDHTDCRIEYCLRENTAVTRCMLEIKEMRAFSAV